MAIILLVCTQLIFTTSDFMARVYMSRYGFTAAAFFSWWFLVYFLIRNIATFGQLYVVANMPLGKTMALFGAVSIVLSNVLGVLFLREILSPTVYIGVSLAVLAFIIMAFR
jgi:multidrug transporter EmrE-like cation transporter